MPPRRPAKLSDGSCDPPKLSTTTSTSTITAATLNRFAKPFGEPSASPSPSLAVPPHHSSGRRLHERRLWQQRERYCYPCIPRTDVDLELDPLTTLDMSTCDCQHRHSPYSNSPPGQSSPRGLGQGMLDGCSPHCIAFILAGVVTIFLASVIYVIARVCCQRLRTRNNDVHRYPDDNKTDFTAREKDKGKELGERAARSPSISNYLELHKAAPGPVSVTSKDPYYDSGQSRVPNPEVRGLNGYIQMHDLATGKEETPKQSLGSRIPVGRLRRGSGLYSGPLSQGLRQRHVTQTAC